MVKSYYYNIRALASVHVQFNTGCWITGSLTGNSVNFITKLIHNS